MKRNFLNIIQIFSVVLLAASCDGLLNPYVKGTYNEDNFTDYPKLVRGLIDHAYNIRPTTYNEAAFMGTDALCDNAVVGSLSSNLRLYSLGNSSMSYNPVSSIWSDDYTAINYVNNFLKDDLGINTQYLLNREADLRLRSNLQGDAYALRAWYHFELLKYFGGVGADGKLLGVPIKTDASEVASFEASDVRRAGFDETVAQILEDCDSAYKYLPLSNRDYPGDKVYVTPVCGSVRYTLFDQVSIDGLRAMVYLYWASPAFNPGNDKDRYMNAATYAAKVMKHKLEKEGPLGFDPSKAFSWMDGNSPEAIFASVAKSSSTYETAFYPHNFGGNASYSPTQDLVDAFPMANGYPITDKRSGYDPKKPYEGRDSRFYSTIFYNGSEVKRNGIGEVMYTFESFKGGKDQPMEEETSRSSYYTRKFVYLGWNKTDKTVLTNVTVMFFERWEQMCLIFAEAANKYLNSATDATLGYSAKQALAYVRQRPTNDGGAGHTTDPYLDECADNSAAFHELVKNEWRLTTCFEGSRYFDLRRWGDNLNVDIHGAQITKNSDGTYSYDTTVLETRNLLSPWFPIPVGETRKCGNLVQNAGYENWK